MDKKKSENIFWVQTRGDLTFESSS